MRIPGQEEEEEEQEKEEDEEEDTLSHPFRAVNP